jgi:hypothetical protein
MSPRNELKGIHVMKFFRHALPKQVSRSTGAHLPGTGNIFGVAPYQITKGAFVWNFLIAINGSHLIQGANVGRQASVYTQDLFVNESGQTKAIEALDAMAPDGGVTVFSQAFVVETIDLRNLATL